VHQASASTLDILAYLSGRLQASPVLFLLVYRAEGAAVRLPERFGLEDGLSENDRSAHTSPLATRLTVQPLAEHDAEQLVRAFMSHRGPAPQVDVDRIVGAGGGVPAKLMHFARAALAGELPSASVVEFRDVLWSRLQSCSPSQRRVFFAAALLQRHSSLSLLAAAAHLPEAATLDAAQALQQMELLAEVGPGYVIAHDVTTNFVVEASGTAGRALLAGWAADALAHDDPHANAELAHLYALAGRTNEAFTHARLAGFQALGARAGVELGRLLGLALTFAPDDRSRREIEQLLASWGSGHRRLPTPEDAVPVDADVVADVEAPSLEGSGETGTSAEEIGPESPDSERPTADRPAAAVAQRPAVRPWYRVRAGLLAAAGLTIALATASRLLQVRGRGGGRVLRDSLLVIPLGADHRLVRPPTVRVITGDIDMTADRIVPRGGVPRLLGPRWIDSVPLPWTSPLPSPDGRFVSLERVGSAGTDVYAVSADRRDTLPLAVGGGQDIAHGWSPDGRYLLVSRARTLRDGSFDSDLWAYPVAAGAPPIPIDTASDRAVTEAAWSPVGTRVAWVARVGADRQQDVFVARPDGSDLRNVSNHPSEDYHIAWSPDGTLIGFTSERTGNANLYAMDVSTSRLWRLTSGDAHDDGLMFSPDGRYAAFESTRGGSAGLYVMPALGGSATRVTPSGAAYALAGWRGQTPGYVARVRIVGPSALPAGDSASWSVIALDSRGDATSVRDVVWEQGGASPLARVVREVSGADAAESGHAPLLSAIGSGDGLLRLVVSIPGWRADTLFVRCGTAEYALLEDAFTRPLESARWFVLGAPVPAVETARGVSGLYPHADLEWESGVLSRSPIDVRENLSIEATMHAQFTGRPTAASSLRIALVAPADMTALDRAAPQFSDLVSVSWDGESRRVTYTVDRESRSEAAGALGAGAAHVFRIVVERGGRIAFYVDEKLRWRSTLQVPLGGAGDEGGLKSQLWLGGRATGDWGAFSGLRVTLEAASSRR
jgi:Tol biopolymer transport system component